MPDLDWIVEYETLPPDDVYLPAPEPPAPRRRPPGWLWVALGLVAVLLAAIIYLWQLGGRTEPLPGPEPATASLESVVQLEVEALNSGDEEIFARAQDVQSRRSHIEPAPENWFDGQNTGRGEVELVGLQLIDEDSAVATVRLTWNGTPFRLYWFYRQVGGSWRHTDWQQPELGQEQTLTTPHFQVTHHAGDSQPAEALAGRLETFMGEFCGLLSCPAGPLSVTLNMEMLDPSYEAAELAPLHYRIPSPLRVRWPWDNRPEPVVLGSVGRHLAYDAYLRPIEEGLPPDNQAPLTLATFWLVHHLLDLEAAPGTRWLDEAVARDGLPAAGRLIRALAEGVDLEPAMASAFAPGTIANVVELPDYFGWLLSQDPMGVLGRGASSASGLHHWSRIFLDRFDSSVEPWAPDGRFFRHVLPEVTAVTYLDGWAAVTPIESTGSAETRFFRQVDGSWVPSAPDETTLGEAKSTTLGPLTLTYYAWDEPFIPDLMQALDKTFQAITADFDLTGERPIVIAIHPSLGVPRPDAETVADIVVDSPRLAQNLDMITAQAVYELAGVLLSPIFYVDRMPEERALLLLGIFLWEMDQLGYGLDTYLSLATPQDWVDTWEPPITATAPEWMSLQELWTPSITDWTGNQVVASLHYSVLFAQYIVGTYGTEKMPLLADTLATADTMDDWVMGITGQPLDLLEADWRAWVIHQWFER